LAFGLRVFGFATLVANIPVARLGLRKSVAIPSKTSKINGMNFL
jgi:hypothetical protein